MTEFNPLEKRTYFMDKESSEFLRNDHGTLTKYFEHSKRENISFALLYTPLVAEEFLNKVTCIITDMKLRAPLDGSPGKDLIVMFNSYITEPEHHKLKVYDLEPSANQFTWGLAEGEFLLGRFTKLALPAITAFNNFRDALVENGFYLERSGHEGISKDD